MSEGLVRSDADVRHPRSMRLVNALATDYLSALDQRSSGEVHHVATGLASMDRHIPAALHEGHLVILAGRPAMGKTRRRWRCFSDPGKAGLRAAGD
jgi:replicative DNA helicase